MNFNAADWDSMLLMISEYFDLLGYKNDAFHHDMLFGGTPYLIQEDGRNIGFFSAAEGWDGGFMLRGLYLPHRTDSAQIFSEILTQYDIRSALVPSNDSLFVALAMEHMQANNGSFAIQAYQYTYGVPARAAEYPVADMLPLLPEEFDEMNRLTEKQWDGCDQDPRFRFYRLCHDGVTLGYGAYVPLEHVKGYADIGNFTLPEYRQKGVGRSLLIHLAQIVRDQGMIPVAGCWAGNRESIPTIKSAGFIPENRIFYVKFSDEKENDR